VISADDGGDPSTALTLVKKMVQENHILALLDPFLLLDFDSITKYAASVHVPIIGGDVFSRAWCSNGGVFPETAALAAEINASNKYLVQQKKTKLGVIACVELAVLCQPASDAIKSNAQSAGASVVYSTSASLTSPSFSSICINAKNAGVTALWSLLDGASDIRLARDCAAQGFHPRYVILAIDGTPDLPKASDLQGSVMTAATFPQMLTNGAAFAAYHSAMHQFAPNIALTAASSQAWTAGALAVAAAAKLSANQPTSAQFFEGLWSINQNNLGGLSVPLTFNRGGHATVGSCAFVLGIQGQKYVAPQGATLTC
jgi:branched-chain amino acid transport system substrate-binding protein